MIPSSPAEPRSIIRLSQNQGTSGLAPSNRLKNIRREVPLLEPFGKRLDITGPYPDLDVGESRDM